MKRTTTLSKFLQILIIKERDNTHTHSVTTSCNNSRPIIPVVSDLGIKLQSHELLPKSDNYRVTVKRLLNDTSTKDSKI
jgi:hypothetical protein